MKNGTTNHRAEHYWDIPCAAADIECPLVVRCVKRLAKTRLFYVRILLRLFGTVRAN